MSEQTKLFCADHKDKQTEKQCPACRIEELGLVSSYLRREISRLRGILDDNGVYLEEE